LQLGKRLIVFIFFGEKFAIIKKFFFKELKCNILEKSVNVLAVGVVGSYVLFGENFAIILKKMFLGAPIFSIFRKKVRIILSAKIHSKPGNPADSTPYVKTMILPGANKCMRLVFSIVPLFNGRFPLSFRSAFHCGYSGITDKDTWNENIECFREYFAVGYRAPDPSFL
jgi:hypothetical protein